MTPRRILIGLCGVILAALLIAAFGCNSSRKASAYITVDSNVVVDLMKQNKKLQEENTVLRSRVKQLETGIEFSDVVPCNEELLQGIIQALQEDLYTSKEKRDSLVRELLKIKSTPSNEVIISSDGEIRARGQIRALNARLFEKSDSIAKMKRLAEQADSAMRSEASKKAVTKTETKEVVKSALFGNLWWLLIIIGAAGGILGYVQLKKLFIVKKIKNGNI